MKLNRTVPLFLFTASAGVLLGQSSVNVIRGPYLQLGTPTSMVIRWRTDVATNSQVVYSSPPAGSEVTNTVEGARTEHEVQLTDLTPDTQYNYTVGSMGAVYSSGTNQSFVTAPLAGTPKRTRIWVIGDAGTAAPAQRAVRDAFYTINDTNHLDLWLQLGDNAYNTGTDAQYQAAVFNMYSDLLAKSVTWPTIGNHDTAQQTTPSTNFPYFSIFTLPTSGEAGGEPSGTEFYYSFNYANIHFICLDSMMSSRSPTGPMATWLEADLQANTLPWIIAFWHHPPYTKGSHNSDTETQLIQMRSNILPILEAYGVDLVLTGHSHSYERSWLLNGHYGLSTTLTSAMILDHGTGREQETGAYVKPRGYAVPNRGAVYAVAGSSGQTSGGTLNHPAMCVSSNVLGSLLLVVESNRLDAIFLRETRATNDNFTIIKKNYAPQADDQVVMVMEDETSNLNLSGTDVNKDPIQFTLEVLPTNGLLSAINPDTGELAYTPAHASTNSDFFTFRVSDGETNSQPGAVLISVAPQQDTNSNGLPDAWEDQYNNPDPTADTDGDGMTALEEYRAGTNPEDDGSWLRITETSANGPGGFTLQWPAIGGVRYRVLFSNAGADGGFTGSFTPVVRSAMAEIAPAPAGTPTIMSFTDDFSLTGGPPPAGERFYRIEVL